MIFHSRSRNNTHRFIPAPIAALLLCIAVVMPTAAQQTDSGAIDVAAYRAGLASGGQVYRVDPARSQLLLQTFKGGFLSAFGHNHLMALRDIDGLVLLAATPAASRAELLIPVTSIEVDNPALRQAAGDEFESKPSASDIAGTRDNMLGTAQLDSAHYPHIRVRVTLRQWRPPEAVLQLTVMLRDHQVQLSVPAKVTVSADELRVSADLELSQRQLGLTPFSALGGTLKVADSIKLSVRLLAHRLEAL